MAIVISPLITRLFSPDDFGVYAYYASWVTVLSVACTFRYESAIPLPNADSDARALVRVSMAIAAVFGMLAGAVLYLLSIVEWLPVEFVRIRPYLAFLTIALTMAGAIQSLTIWRIRKREFSDVAAYRTRQAFIVGSLQIGAGAAGLGSLGLVIANTFAPVINARRLARDVGAWSLGGRSKRDLLGESWAIAMRYWRFPCLSLPSALANSLALQLPSLLLLGMYDATVAGCFALAMRLSALPTGIVSGAIGDVFLSRIAEAAKRDIGEVARLYRMVVRRLLMVGAPVFVLAGAAAPMLFPLIFGERWTTAGYYFSILSLSMLAQFVVRTVSQLMVVMERQDLQLIWDVARLVLVSATFAVAKVMSLSPLMCLGAYAVVMTVCYAAMVVMHLRILNSASGKI